MDGIEAITIILLKKKKSQKKNLINDFLFQQPLNQKLVIMEKIDRKYAIIYIDREGLSLAPHVDNYTPDHLSSEFFKNGGFIQWNFYLIIPKELVPTDKIEEIESNQTFTRKYVIPSEKINDFIEDRFPELPEEINFVMKIIKGNSWEETQKLVKNEIADTYYPSILRDYDTMDTLESLDIIRSSIIKMIQLNFMIFK